MATGNTIRRKRRAVRGLFCRAVSPVTVKGWSQRLRSKNISLSKVLLRENPRLPSPVSPLEKHQCDFSLNYVFRTEKLQPRSVVSNSARYLRREKKRWRVHKLLHIIILIISAGARKIYNNSNLRGTLVTQAAQTCMSKDSHYNLWLLLAHLHPYSVLREGRCRLFLTSLETRGRVLEFVMQVTQFLVFNLFHVDSYATCLQLSPFVFV